MQAPWMVEGCMIGKPSETTMIQEPVELED